ncbi:hypothetical protein ABXJ56_08285 [Microbacterium chocolatum]|uniref:hypothetical protein n=1 Tax=Microbacterium aurantiacum TaxID=162393 RepID=UPI00338DA133
MKPAVRAELEALRLRAYGPAPDIAEDPAALRRLAELESWARHRKPGPEPEFDEESGPEAAAAASARTVAEEESSEEKAAPVSNTESPPERPRSFTAALGRLSPRRLPRVAWVAWTASLIAVAALAAVITYGLVNIAPVAVSQGARQIATLEPDPSLRVPTGWFGAGASSHAYRFFGLTLFETTQGMYGSTSGECLTMVLSSDLPADEESVRDGFSTAGPIYSGCRVGSFPATISVGVDSTSPLELRAQFPGASLQFIKDGDRIGVFLGTSDAD